MDRGMREDAQTMSSLMREQHGSVNGTQYAQHHHRHGTTDPGKMLRSEKLLCL